ncbi:Protein smoothened [Eumeta japonica]|uniref:Protein smoothened n=1 Tax=Eumeta variegata TaxID=151549 RepID=A0A4C1TRS5_EUMVA|nr:Protein smoothened [Eumeta japonica]
MVLESFENHQTKDSQISISLRHVSVESRRNSLDSQVSVKISEMKTKVGGNRRSKHSKAKRKARAAAAAAAAARKDSTPSLESQISRYRLQALTANEPSLEEIKFGFD